MKRLARPLQPGRPSKVPSSSERRRQHAGVLGFQQSLRHVTASPDGHAVRATDRSLVRPGRAWTLLFPNRWTPAPSRRSQFRRKSDQARLPVTSVTGTEPYRSLQVREGGVEPPRPFGHTDLNRARLPIPPLALALAAQRLARGGGPSCQYRRGPRGRTRHMAVHPLIHRFTRLESGGNRWGVSHVLVTRECSSPCSRACRRVPPPGGPLSCVARPCG
jgi:hypothetical protein